MSPKKALVAAGGLVVVVFGVYLWTLHPGLDRGDSAELQYVSPLLGVCHSPGYQIEVAFGKLFSLLPLGDQVAWRINLMMAVCGTIGVLALYGTVRRVTGQITAGLVGAGVLAFSSIYWLHCTLAEAYVFYGMFLLLALYCLERFLESHRARWLYLGALCLGACVADRSSELFVLPAFVLLWAACRRKVKLTPARLALAAAVFVLPFVFTVTSYLVHTNPSRLAYRDDALRDRILHGDSALPKTAPARLTQAVRYCLGLTWIQNAMRPHGALWADAKRYALQLSGLNLLEKKDDSLTRQERLEKGPGVGIGLPGLILAILATLAWRRQAGWVLLGWGIFAGNLAFYLWHHRWDGLTFTVPGLVGLSLLAGLGAGSVRSAKAKRWAAAASWIAPAFLLLVNFSLVNRNTAEEHRQLEEAKVKAAAPLPRDAVLLMTYWPVMTHRYIYHIQAGRPDVVVINFTNEEQIPTLLNYFEQKGRDVFMPKGYFDVPQQHLWLEKQTPPAIVRAGLVQFVVGKRSSPAQTTTPAGD